MMGGRTIGSARPPVAVSGDIVELLSYVKHLNWPAFITPLAKQFARATKPE